MMYDSNNNFRYLSKYHIKPGIRQEVINSKVKSTNCYTRNMSVVKQQEANLKRWKRSVAMDIDEAVSAIHLYP